MGEREKYSKDQLLFLTHVQSLVLNSEIFFFGGVQFCIPRGHQITFELFTWHWMFGAGLECSIGGNGACGFAKPAMCLLLYLTFQEFVLPWDKSC